MDDNYLQWMDTRAVGVDNPAAGPGIRHEVADSGIRLVVVNNQLVVAVGGILRRTAVAVEEPRTVVEDSQPFCFILTH